MILLAVVDTLFLISSLLTFSLPHLSSRFSSSLWAYLVPYTLPIAQTCLTASVYMTISLSLERYFSVVHPLYQLSNRWLKSSLVLSLPGIMFAVIFTLPNYFQLKTVLETSLIPLENITHAEQVSGEDLLENFYIGFQRLATLANILEGNLTEMFLENLVFKLQSASSYAITYSYFILQES